MSRTILPEGHHWKSVPSGAAQVHSFQCACGALFQHDMESETTQFEPGDDGYHERHSCTESCDRKTNRH